MSKSFLCLRSILISEEISSCFSFLNSLLIILHHGNILKQLHTLNSITVFMVFFCVLIGKFLYVYIRQFPTAEEVMLGAQHMVAMQLSHDPLVRQCVRQAFFERARIHVAPTKKGVKVRFSFFSL